MGFMVYLKNQGADFKGFDPTMIPLYDFPDIWQNLVYVAAIIKVLLAFIVVMSIFNEINHRIVRQNVIDGLSKEEWLGTKLVFIAVIAAGATLLLFVNGLVLGWLYSHPDGYASVFQNLEILLAYFIDIFIYLCFAMMLTLLFKKGGLVIVGMLMYTLMLEPFATLLMVDGPDEFPEYLAVIADFFPVKSLRNLVPFPYTRYIFREVQDTLLLRSVAIALGWLFFYVSVSYFLLRKRDI